MQGVSIYRPNNDPAKGSAFQFKPGFDKRERLAVFVEATNQTGPKPPPGSTASPFDWKNKITMMLNVDELSQLAASIRGIARKPIKYVHQTGEGDKAKMSSLTIAPSTNKEYDNWSISFSVRQGGTDTKVYGFIDPGQVYQILCLIDHCIHRSFNLVKASKKVASPEPAQN